MLTKLLIVALCAGASAAQGGAVLNEGAFLQIAPSIRYGEPIASAKKKTSRLGLPEMSVDNRTATWRVAKEQDGGNVRIEFMVHLNEAADAVEVVEVRRVVETRDAWTGKHTVTGLTTLYTLGFVKTPSASWARGNAVGKLRWGMGPADAAAVCPLVNESISINRDSDLPGTLFYKSPFPKRVTHMECSGVPDGLPESRPLQLAFLDDRLVEVVVPAPWPEHCTFGDRCSWVGVDKWVDPAHAALERAYGQSVTSPSEAENEAIAKSLALKGYAEFRNWIWQPPGKFVILRDSGGSGWSYVLYRDSSRADLEPLTKYPVAQ